MSKVLKLVLVAFLCAFFALNCDAREYGYERSVAPYAFRVDGPRKINVRKAKDTSSALLTQLNHGDIIYVSKIEPDNYGHDWYEISGKQGWVYKPNADATTKLIEVANEYYTPVEQQVQEFSSEQIAESHKWGKIIFLIFAIAAAVYSVIWVLYYLSDTYDGYDFLIGEPTDGGLRKLFFFNKEPYQFIILITLGLILSLLGALAAMLLIGGSVFVLLWTVKIVTYILLWVGIIGGILGALALWGGEDEEGKGMGCLGVIIGIVLVIFKDNITNFADSCSDVGLEFLKEFNVLAFAVDLIKQYWAPALFWVAVPLMLFLACAVVWLIFAGLLIAIESLVTWRYNIKHPCPHCHQSSEPALYLSLGQLPIPDDVRLRPGPYGLFHITHPDTGERMPTMLLNGRDSLTRLCPHCHQPINAKEGTERHMILVGGPGSGKSTLAYRFIAEMINLGFEPKFTDEKNSIKNSASVIDKIQKIAALGEITDELMPQKTTKGQTGAMQVMVKRKLSPVDYRLFINDLAGERYTALINAVFSNDSLNFFRDANALVILLDPYTMSFANCTNDFVNDWIKRNSEISEDMKMDPLRLKTALDNAVSAGAVNRKLLHIDIVLAMCDAGYIPSDVNISDSDAIRAFVMGQLGLAPLVQWAEGMKEVRYFALSAMAKGDNSRMSAFTKVLISQLGIK